MLPATHLAPRTPEMRRHVTEPVTPARDPASIDRRGLVGVGELATPRWTRAPRVDDDEDPADLTVNNDDGDYEQEDPDSPWTIEARDGEIESMDHVGRPFSSALYRTDCNSGIRRTPVPPFHKKTPFNGRRKRRRGNLVSQTIVTIGAAPSTAYSHSRVRSGAAIGLIWYCLPRGTRSITHERYRSS